MSKEELITAFHAMWDNYPEQVRLIDKTFLVLAGNKAYLAAGGETGIRCCEQGTPEIHRGCQAQASLKERAAKSVPSTMAGVPCESFWIPVEGETDYFIHYTNGLNEAIARFMAGAAESGS